MTPLCFWIGSLSFGVIRRFLIVVPPLKYTLYPKLLANVLYALTKSTIIWYNYVGLLLLVDTGFVCCDLVVVLFLGFHLYSVESPCGVLAIHECILQVLLFFLQQLWVGADGFYSMSAVFQSHCTWMLKYGDCPTAGRDLCE